MTSEEGRVHSALFIHHSQFVIRNFCCCPHAEQEQPEGHYVESDDERLVVVDGQAEVEETHHVEQHGQRRDGVVVGLGPGQQAREGVGDEGNGGDDAQPDRAEDDPLQPGAPQHPGPEQRLDGDKEGDGVVGVEGEGGEEGVQD